MIDVSVLLLFHARSDHFAKVWAEVRKARPARLFLYQDGPRNEHDMKGIIECRELVKDENIDWPCEVHRRYQKKNYGCDPSGYMSQQWAFSLTDKCIVLEDDVVPSQSFFTFCKEMLDRYENDERVTMIAGFNTENISPESISGCSYFFTRVFSIWGWASWARVINNRDGNYGFVKDKNKFQQLKEKVERYHQKDGLLKMCELHAASGIQYFESIFWTHMLMNDGLAVMPRVNMINNIGLDGGTHYSTQLSLIPRRLRWQFEMPRYDIPFPLIHPTEVKEYPEYQRLNYLRLAWNSPWRKVQYSMEELWLNIIHGNFKSIFKAVGNRIRKMMQ